MLMSRENYMYSCMHKLRNCNLSTLWIQLYSLYRCNILTIHNVHISQQKVITWIISFNLCLYNTFSLGCTLSVKFRIYIASTNSPAFQLSPGILLIRDSNSLYCRRSIPRRRPEKRRTPTAGIPSKRRCTRSALLWPHWFRRAQYKTTCRSNLCTSQGRSLVVTNRWFIGDTGSGWVGTLQCILCERERGVGSQEDNWWWERMLTYSKDLANYMSGYLHGISCVTRRCINHPHRI